MPNSNANRIVVGEIFTHLSYIVPRKKIMASWGGGILDPGDFI